MWNSWKNSLYLLLIIIWLSSKIELNEATGTWTKKQKVCVIGAGPAGLTSAKQLTDYPDEFDITVFERNAEIGGLWLYTDLTGVDKHNLSVYSSIYKNLRTFSPKEMTIFLDYPEFCNPEGRSSTTHETVLSYLKNYTEHFNLRQYIQFNTFVENVTPILDGSDWRNTTYSIKIKNLNTNQVSKTTCDAIIVCNGHFNDPRIPIIPGIKTFPGKVIHSYSYRQPEVFENQTVAVLGAGISGIDISLEIAKYAKTVYLSHNKNKIKGSPPTNIIQVSGVVRVNNSELILNDGSSIKADAFILCTGYNYAFPFLNNDSYITVDDNHVVPIYKHIINIKHPKMSFVGLPSNAPPFLNIHTQSKYVAALLRGKVKLPSKSKMMLDTILPEGKRKRDAHALGPIGWDYADELARLAGFEPVPRLYLEADKKWMAARMADPWNFKENNLYISKNGTVTVCKPSKDL